MQPDLRRTASFGAVGIAATLIYFCIATLGTKLGYRAALASLAAYVVSSLFSYCGHRWLTFGSTAPLSETGPRFLQLTALQYGLAVMIPAGLTDVMGMSATLSYVAVCVVAPLVSYIVMHRYVFRSDTGHSDV